LSAGFHPFLGVAVLAVGLVWLIGGHLDHLCGGFAVFIGVLFGGGYFRDKPARGNIGRAHTPDEYITLKQLQLEVKIFKETIRQVCLI
jgi:hypothetical protein